MNALFTGGGTGGHVYPAIAIADALPEPKSVTFVGTAERLEATLVPKAGYALQTVRARPFARAPLAALRCIGTNLAGIVQSLRVVRRARPDIAIATGGYVCFPVVVATRILRALGLVRARIALLEPNAVPGLTSRMLAPLVDEIWGAYADAPARLRGKYVRTGVPVRGTLRVPRTREDAAARLGLDPQRPLLLAMGGSLGARSINEAVLALPALPAGWQALLICGDAATAQRVPAAAGVRAVPYLDDPADAFALASLVLARAGASTVAELLALGLPAILVPYPHHADEHQVANARALEAFGAAVMLRDGELTPVKLAELLGELAEPARLHAMRAAARAAAPADAIAAILARIAALAPRRMR